jgi:4-hydroxythreonine-4-phosphate dehydrogenase
MSETSNLPVIVIPMGDPNGIGPEIIVKALADPSIYEVCRPLVVGDAWCLARALDTTRLELLIHTVGRPSEGIYQAGFLNLIDLAHPDLAELVQGTVQALAGQCAMAYIRAAVGLAQAGLADALATTPINKESLRAAGVPHIGHTEILASLTGTDDPLTLFETCGLRVFFLTRHVSLRQACDLVTRERVANGIRRCCDALRRLGAAAGTLAVAGLNPHSGEHGLFGDEEMTAVGPAVADCQAEGLDVIGPVSADSVFHLTRIGRYAAVLSLYHDQGHIATKTLDFERTISLTLGLPFLRTSVDHGTALDIAGQGIASAVSMIEAIRLAAHYAPFYAG